MPIATATLRRNPEYRARITGVPRNMSRNSSSAIAASSSRRGANRRGCERRIARHRRAPVPRTNVLANVAPEHVRPDARPLPLGNRAAKLDREIRDAPRRIQPHSRARSPPSGTPRCSACKYRNGPAAAASGAISSDTSSSPRKNHEPCPLIDQARIPARSTRAPPGARTTAPATAPYPRKSAIRTPRPPRSRSNASRRSRPRRITSW